MGKISKTARAAMKAVEAGQQKKKEIIPDEEYIRLLRIDLTSGLYVSQEGARALLREYDKEKAAVAHLGPACASLLARAEEAETEVAKLKKLIPAESLESENVNAELPVQDSTPDQQSSALPSGTTSVSC